MGRRHEPRARPRPPIYSSWTQLELIENMNDMIRWSLIDIRSAGDAQRYSSSSALVRRPHMSLSRRGGNGLKTAGYRMT